MKAVTLYTRKFIGLDYRVWLSMIATWLVCLGLVSYKQLKSSVVQNAPCAKDLILTVNGKDGQENAICYLNQMALFRISADSGTVVLWDFDDGSLPVEGVIAPHTFRTENTFTVKATVNGRCHYLQEITVKAAPSETAEAPEIKIYVDSTKISAGGQLRFSCASNIREEQYEWRVLETGEVQTTQKATFRFATEGTFTVQLMLNGDRANVKTKTIEVAPIITLPPGSIPINSGSGNPEVPTDLLKPGENPFEKGAEAPKKTVPVAGGGNQGANATEPAANDAAKPVEIDPDTFKGLMQAVLDGEKEVSELYPYLEYRESTFVEKIGDDEPMKLPAFCRKHAKRKIQTLEFQKDNKNGIQKIKLRLKKKGLFGGLIG